MQWADRSQEFRSPIARATTKAPWSIATVPCLDKAVFNHIRLGSLASAAFARAVA